jgi:hypothetical protein
MIFDEIGRDAWQALDRKHCMRDRHWSAPRIEKARQERYRFIGLGSFTQPLAELEASGWL